MPIVHLSIGNRQAGAYFNAPKSRQRGSARTTQQEKAIETKGKNLKTAVIVIEGGCLTSVVSSVPLDVILVDYDAISEGSQPCEYCCEDLDDANFYDDAESVNEILEEHVAAAKKNSLGWRVEYRRMCPEWHEKSMPRVVDRDGKLVFELIQNVGHPGEYDEKADRIAHAIVNLVNTFGLDAFPTS